MGGGHAMPEQKTAKCETWGWNLAMSYTWDMSYPKQVQEQCPEHTFYWQMFIAVCIT